MSTENYIPIAQLCTYYEVEIAFIERLDASGFIELETIADERHLHQDRIGDIEKAIRLHHELEINAEGIDVIFNLLQRIEALQNEVHTLRNRLRRFEH
jgi:hypothetical protein